MCHHYHPERLAAEGDRLAVERGDGPTEDRAEPEADQERAADPPSEPDADGAEPEEPTATDD